MESVNNASEISLAPFQADCASQLQPWQRMWPLAKRFAEELLTHPRVLQMVTATILFRMDISVDTQNFKVRHDARQPLVWITTDSQEKQNQAPLTTRVCVYMCVRTCAASAC
jgi:hypothetical protein